MNSSLVKLLQESRSYRRFDGGYSVTNAQLMELISSMRYIPSGANLQALRFVPVNTGECCDKVFSQLKWAGYIPDWDCPCESERPSAYILILSDKQRGKPFGIDVGIAAQSLMLCAVEQGLGGCMFLSFKNETLLELLHLDGERYKIELVIALGKPVEEVRITDVAADGSIRYYRDENGVHYVPKRSAQDLLLEIEENV